MLWYLADSIGVTPPYSSTFPACVRAHSTWITFSQLNAVVFIHALMLFHGKLFDDTSYEMHGRVSSSVSCLQYAQNVPATTSSSSSAAASSSSLRPALPPRPPDHHHGRRAHHHHPGRYPGAHEHYHRFSAPSKGALGHNCWCSGWFLCIAGGVGCNAQPHP